MKHLTPVVMATAAAAALVLGVWAVAGADDEPIQPSGEAGLLSEEAIVTDWCGYVDPAVDTSALHTSVEVVVRSMIAGDATPADLQAGLEVMETAPDPDAARAAAYLYALEGEPAAVAADYTLVRNAGRQAIYGEPLTNPDAVLTAARSIDGFIATTCDSEG